MWKSYRYIASRYPRLTLDEERRLILEAQNGSKQSKDELILRHVSFLVFRINTKLFPDKVKRYGEDILAEAILVTCQKINTYDLNYCDKQGNPLPVKFVSYIWKRIDGFIIDSLRKEFGLYKIHKEYYENEELYEEDDESNAYKRDRIDHRKNQRWRPI